MFSNGEVNMIVMPQGEISSNRVVPLERGRGDVNQFLTSQRISYFIVFNIYKKQLMMIDLQRIKNTKICLAKIREK